MGEGGGGLTDSHRGGRKVGPVLSCVRKKENGVIMERDRQREFKAHVNRGGGYPGGGSQTARGRGVCYLFLNKKGERELLAQKKKGGRGRFPTKKRLSLGPSYTNGEGIMKLSSISNRATAPWTAPV